jgi:hypothetical protein
VSEAREEVVRVSTLELFFDPEGDTWEPVRTEPWMARAGIEPATP